MRYGTAIAVLVHHMFTFDAELSFKGVVAIVKASMNDLYKRN